MMKRIYENVKKGLYYHFCHHTLTPTPTSCQFKWWRARCISCLVAAWRTAEKYRK